MNRVALRAALRLGMTIAPLAVIAAVLRRANRAPEVTPLRFVRDHLRKPGHTVVACVGASLVHGRIGASFVELLSQRFAPQSVQFVNAGWNGDLAYNALSRIDQVVACDPDIVLVLVGSNDVMASFGSVRPLGYRVFKNLPTKPTLDWYRENLSAVAEALTRRTRARIGFCSLPTLGERLDSETNRRLSEYNAVIRAVAEQHGASYVPVHEDLDAWLTQHAHTKGPDFGAAIPRMIGALVQHDVFGRGWDEIATSYGYALFIDGIHACDRGAQVIADSIGRFLASQLGSEPSKRGAAA